MKEVIKMMSYVGCHYSEVAEELVAQYGQYVAEQLAEIALGEEASYDEVELCESADSAYSSHYVLQFSDEGDVVEQYYAEVED